SGEVDAAELADAGHELGDGVPDPDDALVVDDVNDVLHGLARGGLQLVPGPADRIDRVTEMGRKPLDGVTDRIERGPDEALPDTADRRPHSRPNRPDHAVVHPADHRRYHAPDHRGERVEHRPDQRVVQIERASCRETEKYQREDT